MRKLVYVIASTIDGYIGSPDGDMGFFPIGDDVVEFLAEHYPDTLPSAFRAQLGITDGPTRFDTAVMGRATYEPGLRAGIPSPYAHLRQYVVSTTLKDSPDPAVRLVADDPVAWMRELKREPGRDVYLVGGSRLAGALADQVDELVLKVYPLVAGGGIRLFDSGFTPTDFRLTESRSTRGGMSVSTYVRGSTG